MDPDKFILPNSILFEQVEAELRSGNAVWIPFLGRSMEPLLNAKVAKIYIEPINQKNSIKPRDIVLFRYHQEHILHRIVSISNQNVALQGDACYTREQICPNDIIGRLSKVELTSGRIVNCCSLNWKCRSLVSLLRRDLLNVAFKCFNRKIRTRLAPFYFCILFLLMWMPLGGLGVPLNNFVLGIRLDHLLHASIYIPCAWFLMDFQRSKPLQLLLISLGIALLTESVQLILPYRGFDVNDLIANFIGVFLGWSLTRLKK